MFFKNNSWCPKHSHRYHLQNGQGFIWVIDRGFKETLENSVFSSSTQVLITSRFACEIAECQTKTGAPGLRTRNLGSGLGTILLNFLSRTNVNGLILSGNGPRIPVELIQRRASCLVTRSSWVAYAWNLSYFGRLAWARVSLGQLVEFNETLFPKVVCGGYSLVVDRCSPIGADHRCSPQV